MRNVGNLRKSGSQRLSSGYGSKSRYRFTFTLIELLVVIAIISILAAMLMPALAQAKEKARTVACMSTLKMFGMAWGWYILDYAEYPAYCDFGGYPPWQGPPSWTKKYWAWEELWVENYWLWPFGLFEYNPREETYRCPSGAWTESSVSLQDSPPVYNHLLSCEQVKGVFG